MIGLGKITFRQLETTNKQASNLRQRSQQPGLLGMQPHWWVLDKASAVVVAEGSVALIDPFAAAVGLLVEVVAGWVEEAGLIVEHSEEWDSIETAVVLVDYQIVVLAEGPSVVLIVLAGIASTVAGCSLGGCLSRKGLAAPNQAEKGLLGTPSASPPAPWKDSSKVVSGQPTSCTVGFERKTACSQVERW